MPNILDMLVQDIEDSAFPYFFAKTEYRQKQDCVMQEVQWLEDHLDDEEKAHLEQLRAAELCIAALEGAAQIKIALAAGIRFALPH